MYDKWKGTTTGKRHMFLTKRSKAVGKQKGSVVDRKLFRSLQLQTFWTFSFFPFQTRGGSKHHRTQLRQTNRQRDLSKMSISTTLRGHNGWILHSSPHSTPRRSCNVQGPQTIDVTWTRACGATFKGAIQLAEEARNMKGTAAGIRNGDVPG